MINPQGVKQIEELIKNKGNPQELLNKITSNYSPEQMQRFTKFANGFGYTNEILQQYGINLK